MKNTVRLASFRGGRREAAPSASGSTGVARALPGPPAWSRRAYPHWFYLPGGVLFLVIFVVPTLLAFFFSLTRWSLFDWTYIGLDNFVNFIKDQALVTGLRNTIIYAVITSGFKVLIGLPLAALLTSRLRSKGILRSVVFFPVLVSTVAVGITFAVLMHPSQGLINKTIDFFGGHGPAWLTNPQIALFSVAFVDIWKGVGLALVIFMAGILSIPEEYFDAVRLDGGAWAKFRHVIVPLSRNATFTVILLSFIGGLRSFDLIWTMTRGGPGFSTDVIASTIYKEYQAGFYGLSTAGNVILFLAVIAIIYPLNWYFNRKEMAL